MTSSKLRIAVTSEGRRGLEDRVGQHFGRCAAYALVDVQEGQIASTEVVDNPFLQGHAPGEVPNFIASTEANVLLTGGIGHRAIAYFDERGIRVSSGHVGTVAEAIETWLSGAAGGPESCGGGHGDGEHHDHDHDHGHGHGDCGRKG